MTQIAYLAGPIDDIKNEEVLWWVDPLKRVFTEIGVNSYSPFYAITQTPFLRGSAEKICAINRHAVMCCDFLVAYLAGKGRGFGTIREIEYARACAKPVYVIGHLQSLEAHDIITVDPRLMTSTTTWRGILGIDPPPVDGVIHAT